MKICKVTIESGAVYRAVEFTGITRTVETGNGARTDHQVNAWDITHPDDPHTETVASPYGRHERPVGVGKFIGIEWV